MKKRFLIPLLALPFLIGGIATSITYFSTKQAIVAAYAETVNEEVETPTDEEETSKWKQLYEDAQNKLKEVSNYQFLGITLGSIVSVLASLGLSYLMGKINRDNIHKQGEQLVRSGENIIKVEKVATNINDGAIAFQQNLIEYKAIADEQVRVAKEETAAAKEEVIAIKEKSAEERKMFLAVISNDPNLVANGTAEKLNKIFGE